MPQVIVDTATESPASLVLLSRLFQDYALLRAKDEQLAAHEYPTRESDAPIAHAGSDMSAALHGPTCTRRHLEGQSCDCGPGTEADPAVLFAANKPFTQGPAILPQVVPLAPVTVAAVTIAEVPGYPPAILAADTPADGTPTPAPVTVAGEVDKAGVPWDARIHSSAKGKKQDGTWKLMRGVDKSQVTMVLHEITPKPHVVGGVIVPAGTVMPVTAAPPVTVPAVAVPVPPQPAPVPAAPMPGADGVAVPVQPVAVPTPGAVPVAPGPLNAVQQFQAFMQLVTAAQNAKTLTHAQVSDAAKEEGVPQIQLLITMPEKIPAVKARLGLV